VAETASQKGEAQGEEHALKERHLPFPVRMDTLGSSVKSLFREFFRLCWQEKTWWLIPLIVVLLLGLAAVFLLASNSGISWALYPSK
jgi:hypothetical protein